jgi:hypothetical protein
MKDYSKGLIYIIKSKNTDDVYIGSTIVPINTRFKKHLTNFRLNKLGKDNYVSSSKILEYGDCYIELLESYPCNDKIELLAREGMHQQNIKCINKNRAGRSPLQYYHEVVKIKPHLLCEDCGHEYRNKLKHNITKKHTNYLIPV